jgi:hypothetical protein
MCTSGQKHETFHMGVFEYADFKKCGNHDVISTVPVKIGNKLLKI